MSDDVKILDLKTKEQQERVIINAKMDRLMRDFDSAREMEVQRFMARLLKIRYDALISEGFTAVQAIQIIRGG